jgi:hypothetical protein
VVGLVEELEDRVGLEVPTVELVRDATPLCAFLMACSKGYFPKPQKFLKSS